MLPTQGSHGGTYNATAGLCLLVFCVKGSMQYLPWCLASLAEHYVWESDHYLNIDCSFIAVQRSVCIL